MHRFGLLFLLFILATGVFAQVSAPPRDQTQAAVLADMTRRTGETVTINSLASQQWYYGTYDFVRGLGCPLAPQTPPTTGNWQRFIFNYRGLDYIYMVSDNLQSLILCNEPTLPTAIPASPTATATQQGTGQSGGGVAQTQPAVTQQGSGQSGGGFAATATPNCNLSPRLRIGVGGNVTPGDANWLHSGASRSTEKIGEIPAGAYFEVLAGPVCDTATGMNYWQVNYNGVTGWTSEGLNGEYWLEPNYAFLANTVNDAFVPDWAQNPPADSLLAISPLGDFIAISMDSISFNLIHTIDDSSRGYTPFIGTSMTCMEFSLGGNYLLIGYNDGSVAFGNVQPEYATIERLVHEAAITALAMTHNESVIVVADEARILSFWSTSAPDAPIRRIELPSVAGDLEFSTDDRLLIVRDQEGQFLTALQVP